MLLSKFLIVGDEIRMNPNSSFHKNLLTINDKDNNIHGGGIIELFTECGEKVIVLGGFSYDFGNPDLDLLVKIIQNNENKFKNQIQNCFETSEYLKKSQL